MSDSPLISPERIASTFKTRRHEHVGLHVEELLAAMTLSEKIGQMTQLTLEAVSQERGTLETPHTLNLDKLETVLVNHHVGSLLNVWDLALTPESWLDMLATIQEVATGRTRLGIPVLYGIDAVHGANYTLGGTIFPHNLNLAATWDPDLVRRIAEATAREVRACGIPWTFAPVLDLGRQPLWSRFFETFGEDVHLATTLGVATVEGLQGNDLHADDRVAACAKHFLGYSVPLSGRDRTPAWIPELMLREYFLPPFAAAVRAGVRTMMINSGEINGLPVHASAYLLTDMLRHELGFDGVVVTDWEDITKLHTIHRVAEDEREAVRLAVEAGIDMSMTPFDLSFQTHLVELVEDGVIAESRIDQSVRRILQLKADLGLFEAPLPPQNIVSRVGTHRQGQLSLEAARASVVLLANDGTLPLPDDTSLCLVGPAAASRSMLHGPWSYTWQGDDEAVYPEHLPTLQTALEASFGRERITYVPGATQEDAIDLAAVAEAAGKAKVALVCLGERPAVEKPGDIDDLCLPEVQLRLAEAVIGSGTPTVLLLAQGRPRLLQGIAEKAAAVVLMGLPGPWGAQAVVEVLQGTINPSGKLPFTYPRSPGELVAYDHKWSDRVGRAYGSQRAPEMDGLNPQWRFGHGMSYTSFAYSDLYLEKDRLESGETLHIEVTVTNVGDRSGQEVVQLYVRDLYASLTPPVKRLRAFRKIRLQSGTQERLSFYLPLIDCAFINARNQPVLEPGDFEVAIGGLCATFTLVASASA